jgi:RimJ/RimL family protein N-acetyltransferase
MPDPPPIVIDTERLVLRRLTMEDLGALASLYADPEARHYFPGRNPDWSTPGSVESRNWNPRRLTLEEGSWGSRGYPSGRRRDRTPPAACRMFPSPSGSGPDISGRVVSSGDRRSGR